MSYKADRTLSPTSKLILQHLSGKNKPESVIDLSDHIGSSYWTVRILCRELAEAGLLTLTLNGKSPYYSLAQNQTEVQK
jgi:DNA-binding transcriptional ArsR family regulator